MKDNLIVTPRQDMLDRTFQATGLSVGLVAGTQKDTPFGHPLYRAPTCDTRYRIEMGNAANKEKNKSYVDRVATRLAWVPGPKYVAHRDWRENIKSR